MEIKVVLRKIATASRFMPYTTIKREPSLTARKSSAIAMRGENMTGSRTGRRIVSRIE